MTSQELTPEGGLSQYLCWYNKMLEAGYLEREKERERKLVDS